MSFGQSFPNHSLNLREDSKNRDKPLLSPPPHPNKLKVGFSDCYSWDTLLDRRACMLENQIFMKYLADHWENNFKNIYCLKKNQ